MKFSKMLKQKKLTKEMESIRIHMEALLKNGCLENIIVAKN